MKKAVAVILAFCMFGSVAAFAASEDFYILDPGMEWLCEEHHVIKHNDDICPECYPIYYPATRAIGNSSGNPSAIRYYGSNGLTYSSSYFSMSYDSAVGQFNATISSGLSGTDIVFYFVFPDLWNGDYSKPSDYPYYILQFEVDSPASMSMSEDVSDLQFGVSFGNATYFQTQYQKQIQFSKVSNDHYEVVLTGEAIRNDQTSYAVAIAVSGLNVGDVISISNALLQTSNDYEGDTPVITPPGPLEPPTESDQWLDEQFQGAVNPELNDKLNDANTKIEQIEEIESSVIDQLDQYYSQVSPDNIEFHSNLISSMRWIGTQFDECLGSVNTYGLMGVVTLPLFVGLCLLLIGRGGQAMASTRLRIRSVEAQEMNAQANYSRAKSMNRIANRMNRRRY